MIRQRTEKLRERRTELGYKVEGLRYGGEWQGFKGIQKKLQPTKGEA
jgi:hypothetical protein